MEVIRLEHREKETGPFVGGAYSPVYYAPDRKECPYDKELQERAEYHTPTELRATDYRFGVSSLEELYNHWWGPRGIKEFLDNDFVLRVFAVPDHEVHKGIHQLIFNRDAAKLVKEIKEIN